MRIRTLEPDDYPAAAELWRGAPPMGVPSREEVLHMLERNPQLALVAEDGSRLVGVVLGSFDGRRGYVARLAVAVDARRGRVATRVLDELERRFADMGVHGIRALVRGDDPGARAFWESRGYAEFEDVVLYGRDA